MCRRASMWRSRCSKGGPAVARSPSEARSAKEGGSLGLERSRRGAEAAPLKDPRENLRLDPGARVPGCRVAPRVKIRPLITRARKWDAHGANQAVFAV